MKEKNFSDKANEELRLYNATMRINRLEMLKANIGLELISGHDELDKYMAEILKGRTMEELERQAGILGKTIKNNAKFVDSVVNGSFNNATFSDRVWMYQDLLKNQLSGLLQSGMIQGKNPRELARQLKPLLADPNKGATYNAERLMRTELARVQTEAQKQSFKRNGFSEYEFIANSGCCDICQRLNGKHFRVDKMMPGENAAPLHPHCRCSTAAWEDSEEYNAWIDYLDKGGTTAEWNTKGKAAWEKAQKVLENSVKSGIIKSGVVTGARNPYSKAADDHAKRYYGLVRSMKTDAKNIAKNTGYSEAQIKSIKKYLFIDKHDLGEDLKKRFEPDFMIAESWQRLIDGSQKPHDITLIKHELLEKELMGKGMSQDKAHIDASKKYNYEKEASEFYGKIKKYRD